MSLSRKMTVFSYEGHDVVTTLQVPPVPADDLLHDLKVHLEDAVSHLFAIEKKSDIRWNEDFFPFTDPSLELEVRWAGGGKDSANSGGEAPWLEVLGSGVLQPKVLQAGGVDTSRVQGWAFGLGLERLAMLLFRIPDIRLFWSDDERFQGQFEGLSEDLERGGERWREVKFKPFSKYPAICKDISFWLPSSNEGSGAAYAEGEVPEKPQTATDAVAQYCDNDFFEILREDFSEEMVAEGAGSVADAEAVAERKAGQAGCFGSGTSGGENIVEAVELLSEFSHPKTGRRSKAYRITYRHMSRTLTHDQVNRVQDRVRREVSEKLRVELR